MRCCFVKSLRLFPTSPAVGNLVVQVMLYDNQTPIPKQKSFRFNRILVAIAGVAILPSIILGVNVTTVTTFSP